MKLLLCSLMLCGCSPKTTKYVAKTTDYKSVVYLSETTFYFKVKYANGNSEERNLHDLEFTSNNEIYVKDKYNFILVAKLKDNEIGVPKDMFVSNTELIWHTKV